MRPSIRPAGWAAVLAWTLCAQTAFAGPSLYDRFSGKAPVKTHVEVPVDDTGQKQVDVRDLKAEIETALKERKSVRFDVQAAPEGAQLVIGCRVTDRMFTLHDPVDMLVGIGGTAIDAATVEHYTAMEAEFEVREGPSGTVLWKEKLRATITHPSMTEEESRPLINRDLAKVFVQALTAKRRR